MKHILIFKYININISITNIDHFLTCDVGIVNNNDNNL